jgi:hypothetical protein|tara:strand:- start:551 stop:994 length:444 start_codon:yes stop_codon:yes gene_type:complete
MKFNKLILFGFLSSVFLISSCSKEQGCMDSDAVNFNLLAEEDDNSCQYEGKVVFWYGQTSANGLISDGAISLSYNVDGQNVGSSASNVYWTGAPDCGQDASLTVTKDLGNVKTQSYSYNVVDQDGFEYWTGTINFNANTCTSLELEW